MSVEVAFTVAAYGLILGIFAGWSTFRVMYRPWRPGDHSLVGRHLIRTADSMIALTGVSLIGAVLPLPMPLMQVVTVLVLACLCWVAWERVHLLRKERRERQATKPPDRQAGGSSHPEED